MKYSSALLLGLLVSSPAFAEIDASKLPPPAAKPDVTFAADIQPLFKASCVGCHGGERPKGGLRLDTLENTLKGTKDGKVLTPGDSAKSSLVIAISQLDPKSAMPPKPRGPRRGPAPGVAAGADTNHPAAGMNPPPGGPGGPAPGGSQRPPPKPLTPTEVGLVRAWIDQGAK